MLKCRATISLPTVSTRLARNSALAGFGRTDPHAYNIPIRALRVRVAELRPPVFRRFADSGCSRSVILSYHYSTTNLHEFTTLSNLP
jgi:hypothetical protein